MSIFSDIDPTFKRDALIGYSLEYDEDAIKNSLLNIFTIDKGDVPGKPGFGNPMNIGLFDLFDFHNQKTLEAAVENVVATYEPRVTLHNIVIVEAPEFNRIIIQLEYSFIIDDTINFDTLEVPYSHNTISFLGGRIRPPEPAAVVGSCVSNN